MSDQDQVKPYHAGGGSTGQEAADVVADVLRHAQERDEAAQRKTGPRPQPKWMLPVAMNLGLLAVYFLVAQPSWTTVNPIQPPPSEVQVQSLRTAMFLAISRIEAFQEENGRLPASLGEAGAGAYEGTVDYQVRPDSTFVLVSSVGDQVVSFDSATMTPAQFTGGPLTLPG